MIFKKAWDFIWRHKIIALFCLILIIAGIVWFYSQNSKQQDGLSYVTEKLAKGILVSTVSGSGQVSASNQVEIQPKASGDLVSLNIKVGQKVKEGDVLGQIDSRTASRQVNEAKSSLENAKLDLAELLAPANSLELLQAENSLKDAEDTLAKLELSQVTDYQAALQDKSDAETDLSNTYEDAYNSIADTFLDLPDVMTDLYDVLYGSQIDDTEVAVSNQSNGSALLSGTSGNSSERGVLDNLLDKADEYYQSSRDKYEDSFAEYRVSNRYSDKQIIENLLSNTINTVKELADSIKSQANFLDYWVDYREQQDWPIYDQVISFQSLLAQDTATVNSHLSSLLTLQRNLANTKQTLVTAENSLVKLANNQPLDLAAAQRNVKVKEEQLNDLKNGATELEIKNKQLAVQQKENSLLSAQQTWSDYYIKAPFAGTVAAVNVAKGDHVGSSAVATLITEQKLAEISLNEIDASKLALGQKATLSFDAVSELAVTGQVVEIDSIGTVEQGVVSYNVKVAFDIQDERIKAGMSTSVEIITESKIDVLLVSASAVKTSNNSSYVEVLVNGQPQRKTVTIGSSNDTMIEIIEGLSEGDEVITQTLSGTAIETKPNTPSTNFGGVFGGGPMR